MLDFRLVNGINCPHDLGEDADEFHVIHKRRQLGRLLCCAAFDQANALKYERDTTNLSGRLLPLLRTLVPSVIIDLQRELRINAVNVDEAQTSNINYGTYSSSFRHIGCPIPDRGRSGLGHVRYYRGD